MLIENTTGYIHNVGGVQLTPGTNQVTESQSKAFNEAIKANKLDAFLVNKGGLKVMATAKGKTAADITDMKVEDAAGLIANTASVDTLTAWLADEKRGQSRKSMITALEARLAELQPAEDTK